MIRGRCFSQVFFYNHIMVVLHIGAIEDQLFLWGEFSLNEEEQGTTIAPSSTEKHPDLPRQASVEELRSALTEAGLSPDVGEAVQLTIWLPSIEGVPVPSSSLIAEIPQKQAKPELVAWRIPAFPLSVEDATVFLGTCMGREMLAPGILPGSDVIYFSKVLRFAGEIVAREQFLPGLEGYDGDFRAQWEPVLLGEDASRSTTLGNAMPHVCRALTRNADAPPSTAPVVVLTRVLGTFVDHLVRTSVVDRPLRKARTFDSVHDAWFYALCSPDGKMDAPEPDLKELSGAIKNWRRRIAATAESPFRLTFRLEEPELTGGSENTLQANLGPWYVRYLLQASDDPSLFIEIANAWNPDRKTEAIFEKRGFDSFEYLLTSLGQAVTLWPAMEFSLKQREPSGMELDTAGAFDFLMEKAWLLQQSGFGVQLPSWWTRRGIRAHLSARTIVRSPKMQASSNLSLDTIVAFDWQVALGKDRLTLEELETLAKMKVPLVRIRGQWVMVDAESIQKALDYWKKEEAGQITLREVVRMALGTGQAPGGLPFEGVEATGWVGDLLHKLENGETVEELPAPEGFIGTLRPYQVRGYSWLAFLQKWGFGACLADDMGLGKTIQALALIQRSRETNGRRPVLLICPTSVMGNWQKEATRFTPALPVLLHHGTSRTKKSANFKKEAQQYALVISSYPLIHRDFDLFQQVKWGAIILDEAQNIKNPETRQAKSARSLKADYRIALTGTPVENNVGELWSIMEFLNPGLLGKQAEFRRRFFIPIQTERDPEAMQRLKHLTGPFILRRLKTDRSIIKDLPEKLDMNVFTTLTKEQASLYRAVVKETEEALTETEGIQRKGLILATLMKLKQICNHPAQFLHDGSATHNRSGKLVRLTEMLEELYEVREHALIFTQFTEMGDLIKRHLQETFGREVLFLHGSVPQKKRDYMVERFQQDANGPLVFLLSLKAGGTGLNLTRASHVFHFDRWWNPAVENQATDRAFRIGQTRQVQVHKFVCIGTVEERINEMIEQKKEIAEGIVGTSEDWITELSTRELKQLFKLRKEAVEG